VARDGTLFVTGADRFRFYDSDLDGVDHDFSDNPDIRRNFSGRIEGPIYYWVPSIAPSGMMFYTGDLFPEWKGNLFIGAMAGQHLVRLVLNGERGVSEEKLLADRKERIRYVRQGPDGSIYVVSGAGILRLTPKK
jgi:aldose sugar dehydrogenase